MARVMKVSIIERGQAIAAAAHFLEFDGLIVPSARAPVLNLVLFLDQVVGDAQGGPLAETFRSIGTRGEQPDTDIDRATA